MENNEVATAFEIVLEEIESVVDSLNQEGADAFQTGNYENARKLIEVATRITDYRSKVKSLQKEWVSLFSAKVPKKVTKTASRSYTTKLTRGLRTPEDSFRKPILETLVELGGSAPVSTVLDALENKMSGVLNDCDKQPLKSYPHSIRWRNSAQWCQILVQEGFLKEDSPRGVWEVSEKGVKALRDEEIN